MIQVDGIFVQQGGGGPVFPEFTYTGEYRIVNEGTPDWKIYFTSSGTFTPASNIAVQVQAIGGGSGGSGGNVAKGGGGGNSMVTEIILESNVPYEFIIGSGGAGGASYNAQGSNGGNTTAFGLIAYGGVCGVSVDVFEFNDSSGIRQSGSGGNGRRGTNGLPGENAGDIDPNVGGGLGGAIGMPGGNGNFGSAGGKGSFYDGSPYSGGSGGGGGYGGGGGSGGVGRAAGYGAAGGAGAPGVVIMRNTRLSA